ncbi:MAG: hypothetical protein U5L72_16025 [Bacteroidales bacterium]|nr:hypothetical protein [Bacteroidales bacterium]
MLEGVDPDCIIGKVSAVLHTTNLSSGRIPFQGKVYKLDTAVWGRQITAPSPSG